MLIEFATYNTVQLVMPTYDAEICVQCNITRYTNQVNLN